MSERIIIDPTSNFSEINFSLAQMHHALFVYSFEPFDLRAILKMHKSRMHTCICMHVCLNSTVLYRVVSCLNILWYGMKASLCKFIEMSWGRTLSRRRDRG